MTIATDEKVLVLVYHLESNELVILSLTRSCVSTCMSFASVTL